MYSFYRWNGVGPMTWVGLKNYTTVFEVPDLLGTIFNAFWLVIWFSLIPVTLGLIVASVIHRVATGRLGEVSRTVLFLPQVIPLVAAGIIWGWLLALPGLVNQILKAVGLSEITRAWLGDFDFALPAVGVIGVWVLLGFCIVYVSTAGGPGNSTAVPGIQIYILAFTQRAVGLASALAVLLMLLVVVVIIPIQRLSRESAE
jgi:raffinose/stachyose/melibiose transport system permease protein